MIICLALDRFSCVGANERWALRLDLPRPLLFNPFSLFVTPFPLVHTTARICAETTHSRQPRVFGCPTGF